MLKTLKISRFYLVLVLLLMLSAANSSGHPNGPEFPADCGSFHHCGDFTVETVVGVGKAPNAGVRLHVFERGEGDAVVQIQADGGGGDALLRFGRGGNTPWDIGYTNEGDFQFILRSGPNLHAMTLARNGDVGIGTSVPNSKLEVEGYIQLDTSDGQPPTPHCDESIEVGRMKVDGATGLLWICVDEGWIAK